MWKQAFVISFIVLCAAIYIKLSPRDGLSVETKSGLIKGIITSSRDGRDVYEWRGIPYGAPPVGKLRFAPPEPPSRWEGVRDASRFGSKCAQVAFAFHIDGDEDCLFLNIYKPKIKGNPRLPVMVFIPGGSFQDGSGDTYGGEYFMDEDVILVTLNYRLGPFGFLTTGDSVVRGNMGLRDQILALKWVQDNIASFGGDPSQVTIFGESAGGASVEFLLTLPGAKGLFSRAISQSGSAYAPWALDTTETARSHSRDLVESLNCLSGDSQELLECMRGLSANEILQVYQRDILSQVCIFKPHLNGHMLRPSLEAARDEEALLIEDPLQVLNEGRAQKVPHMLGLTTHEGVFASSTFYKSDEIMTRYEDSWESKSEQCFGIPRRNLTFPELKKKVKGFYFPDDNNSELSTRGKAERFTRFFTDVHFSLYASHTASVQRVHVPTYFYVYSRTGGPSLGAYYNLIFKDDKHGFFAYPLMLISLLGNQLLGLDSINYGTVHADELPMLLNFPFGLYYVPKGSTADYRFSKDLVKLWASFAQDKTTLELRGVEWKPLEKTGALNVFDISEQPRIIPEPFHESVQFLKSFSLPSLRRNKFL